MGCLDNESCVVCSSGLHDEFVQLITVPLSVCDLSLEVLRL